MKTNLEKILAGVGICLFIIFAISSISVYYKYLTEKDKSFNGVLKNLSVSALKNTPIYKDKKEVIDNRIAEGLSAGQEQKSTKFYLKQNGNDSSVLIVFNYENKELENNELYLIRCNDLIQQKENRVFNLFYDTSKGHLISFERQVFKNVFFTGLFSKHVYDVSMESTCGNSTKYAVESFNQNNDIKVEVKDFERAIEVKFHYVSEKEQSELALEKEKQKADELAAFEKSKQERFLELAKQEESKRILEDIQKGLIK